MQVKALACELPCRSGVPLSRFSHDEIAREVVRRGIAAWDVRAAKVFGRCEATTAKEPFDRLGDGLSLADSHCNATSYRGKRRLRRYGPGPAWLVT